MIEADALRKLFRSAGSDHVIELRSVGAGGRSVFVPPDELVPLINRDLEQYFGVCPRDGRGKVMSATCVWADLDAPKGKGKPADGFPLEGLGDVNPTPTVEVASGTGRHLYWALNQAVDPLEAVRLTKLASVAFHSDKAVCEPHRVMRLPGSYNHKYNPAKQCTVESCDGPTYDFQTLEEYLVAASVATVYEDGICHHLCLSLGAVLARANWSEDRVRSTVTYLCEIQGDERLNDRLEAALGTLRRREAGTVVSAAVLRDALDKSYKQFIDGLGITAHDGEISLDGEVIGKTESLERDLVDYVVNSEEWSWADGVLVQWDPTAKHWKTYPKEALASWVFSMLGRCTLVSGGDEKPLEATAKLAKDVAAMSYGLLMGKPLNPFPDHLLPLRNGILDLKALELREHDRALGARWVLDVDYDPTAPYPKFNNYLDFVLPNERNFLQEWIGYLLVPGNRFQLMLWLYGRPGTGKSTLLNVISGLVGPACVAVRADNLGDYTVANLGPARVAVCSEMGNRQLKTATIKALVSGDTMPARHPYGRPFSVKFRGKLVWSSNTLPPMDQSEGMWRRLVVIPFENKPDVPNVNIDDELREELPGILNWAIAGLQRVREYEKTGLWVVPSPVADIVEEYRQSADPFEQFTNDELEKDPEGVISAKDLYSQYAYWCKERGFIPEPLGPIFWREMRRNGLEPGSGPPRKGGRPIPVWKGANLRPDEFH